MRRLCVSVNPTDGRDNARRRKETRRRRHRWRELVSQQEQRHQHDRRDPDVQAAATPSIATLATALVDVQPLVGDRQQGLAGLAVFRPGSDTDAELDRDLDDLVVDVEHQSVDTGMASALGEGGRLVRTGTG